MNVTVSDHRQVTAQATPRAAWRVRRYVRSRSGHFAPVPSQLHATSRQRQPSPEDQCRRHPHHHLHREHRQRHCCRRLTDPILPVTTPNGGLSPQALETDVLEMTVFESNTDTITRQKVNNGVFHTAERTV